MEGQTNKAANSLLGRMLGILLTAIALGLVFNSFNPMGPSLVETDTESSVTNSVSLSPDEVYSLTAYLLFLNGIVGETDVMNAATLPKVVMPNHDNFDVAYKEPRRR